MNDYTPSDLRSLADHIDAGKSLCTHDKGHEVANMLRSAAGKIEYLESLGHGEFVCQKCFLRQDSSHNQEVNF